MGLNNTDMKVLYRIAQEEDECEMSTIRDMVGSSGSASYRLDKLVDDGAITTQKVVDGDQLIRVAEVTETGEAFLRDYDEENEPNESGTVEEVEEIREEVDELNRLLWWFIGEFYATSEIEKRNIYDEWRDFKENQSGK